MIFLVFASVVVILWVGAQDVVDQRITAGRLSQFVLYAVFAAGALGELSQMFGEISQAAGAAERLTEVLAVRPMITAPPHPAPLPERAQGEVAFERVRFAYPARRESVALDDVSFRIRRGEKVAIVGPSGAGKSTIFHLILRFYDPDAGDVTFDGVRLTDVDPRELRAHIALVPQDAMVFAASVAENIRFGRPDASEAEMCGAPPNSRRLPSSSRACRRDWTRRSASAASCCRAASGSALRLPARSCAGPRCCCSTRRPPRSTPRTRRWCRRPLRI